MMWRLAASLALLALLVVVVVFVGINIDTIIGA